MIVNPMDVLHQFPVRKSKKQKQAFRDAVCSYAEGLGYPCIVEAGSSGSRNVVIGNPETAKYLITAHYDTCAGMPFPNIVTPTNLAAYLAYQISIVLAYLAVCGALGFGVYALTSDREMSVLLALAVYYILVFLMMFGPANKHNANDNTSGVVTVLEIMKQLPEMHCGNVCFILFDLEEAGLVGSKSYAKAHKSEIRNQLVLNMDCVGDGDEIVFLPGKKVRKNPEMLETLRAITGSWGEKSITLHEKGFAFYPSDQSSFPYGVAIGAFHRKNGVGLYYSRIHTNRDTILEEENVSILCRALMHFITGTAQ